MKFFAHISLAATLLVAAAGAASACEGWGCEWNQKVAYGDAEAAGISAVGFDADYSNASAVSVMNATVYTNTKPIAEATAEVNQFTEGYGASYNYLEGGLYQAGSTSVYADDGLWSPEAAGTSTYGEGQVLGYAYGDDSVTLSDLHASSTQQSAVSDGYYGEVAEASAAQAVSGTVMSVAEGQGSAAAGGSVSVSSGSEAHTGLGEKG